MPLIEQRAQASPSQVEAFDHIIASRGRMLRPFAALMHRPEVARAVADLGGVLRFSSGLTDAVRELAIYATAVEGDCGFERDAHRPLALEAGVPESTLDAVVAGDDVADDEDRVVVDFARQLCRSGRVDDPVYGAAVARLGAAAVVELIALVGYYTMLALVLGALEAG